MNKIFTFIPMITDERTSRPAALEEAARAIMSAGRTAPKAKGIDIIEIITVTGDDKTRLAQGLRNAAEDTGMRFFLRDADNLDAAGAVILVGTRRQTMGLNCHYCGFDTCAAKLEFPDVPCAINSLDVGIAVGSMVSKAADLRIDSRVLFSAGYAAERLKLLDDCRNILAIPLSISSKSPFFYRQPRP